MERPSWSSNEICAVKSWDSGLLPSAEGAPSRDGLGVLLSSFRCVRRRLLLARMSTPWNTTECEQRVVVGQVER